MRRSVKYVPAPKPYNLKPEEITYGDLPPLENLDMNVEESVVEKIGIVRGIVDLEAVIETRAGLKSLHINSVLFLSNKKPLGKVCNVYGPVTQPYYSVRFKSKEHLKKVGVEVGMEVFFAPERTEITGYVFPEELQKLKGSDASGRNGNEPSKDNLDFSDEKKKQARVRRKRKRQAEREKDSRNEPAHTNQQVLSPGSSESNANHFYATNNVCPETPIWRPHRSAPTSIYSNTPRQQLQRSSNFAQTGNSYVPQCQAPTYPASKYRTEVYQPQPSQFQPQPSQFQPQPSQFQPAQFPFPQLDMSTFPPPSPLVQLQPQPQGGPIPFTPPFPLPYQQQPSQHIGCSQDFVQQQPSQHIGYSQHFVQQHPPIGPPRPISVQHMHWQMTPVGPLSQAPHLSYAPPTIESPHPSTAFPPASPNFSYFSPPFPSAPSPGPSVSHQVPPSPGGMQVMSPMSPLSIQIPNSVESPPSTMMADGYNYHSNNLLQLNVGSYGAMQRY